MTVVILTPACFPKQETNKQNENDLQPLQNKPETRSVSPQLSSLGSQALVEGKERVVHCYLTLRTF